MFRIQTILQYATKGDLDKTAMSKIYSVVDALDTDNEVRKHQPDGAYVFAAKKGTHGPCYDKKIDVICLKVILYKL